MKPLLAYTLIAALVWVLQRPGCTSNDSPKEGGIIYVPRTDTIVKYIDGAKIVKTVIRRDTVHDRVVVDKFTQVDTPVLILFADRDENPDVRLYEGACVGEEGKCGYKYLAGIHNDSLQFLIVETDCKRETQIITIENPLGFAPAQDPFRTLMVGGKMGMTFDKSHKTYGVQATYGGLYASVDYVPAIRKPVLECGLLFPIRRKNKPSLPVSDTLRIGYN